MTRIITHLLAFVAGVWFALENPYFGRTIKEYAEFCLAWASQFIGG
ncbi:TPA: hypothetical protein ACGSTL_001316 [Vibrio parahaemolyticus]|nr:hypothetical protein [Vibrio campbellii]UMM06761.1 hypothetical protein MKR81_26235 [Vibrio campbellii]